MRFLSVIKSNENFGAPPKALEDAIGRMVEDGLKDGSLVETGGLAPTSAGARVRISGRKLSVTDGPFTESKEVIGGYAIFEYPSKREAIDATVRFMELHRQHWPEWDGECELRELVFFAAGNA
jgi:hypothetical protein